MSRVNEAGEGSGLRTRSPSGRDRAIVGRLTAWFAVSARPLLWRTQPRDAYRSLVSEFMLQQTQVSRVLEKFGPFIVRFPTIGALAAATEDDVLAAWSGLGYYRRARLLHAAARGIVADFEGTVPRDTPALMTIPGIGRYTAGAISSIVFGRNAPIVDGNVTRVLLRLDGVMARHGSKEAADYAWPRAETLAGAAHGLGVIAAFNEGLMELGATVCTPRNPACGVCPLRAHCRARKWGTQEEIPLPKKAPARLAVVHTALLVKDEGERVLLEKRSATGMWSNMWQAPTLEGPKPAGRAAVLAHLGVEVGAGVRLRRVADFVHTTSHREIRFIVLRVRSDTRPSPPNRCRWFGRAESATLALSNPHRAIVALGWGAD